MASVKRQASKRRVVRCPECKQQYSANPNDYTGDPRQNITCPHEHGNVVCHLLDEREETIVGDDGRARVFVFADVITTGARIVDLAPECDLPARQMSMGMYDATLVTPYQRGLSEPDAFYAGYTVKDAHGHDVALMLGTDFNVIKANGFLFAAAPELYAACVLAYNALSNAALQDDFEAQLEAKAALLAAIEKVQDIG